MHTRDSLREQLEAMNIDPKGTLLVHSSMKAIGQVEGGADTVLDVLCVYMKDGLLIFPTHTWRQMSPTYTVFDVKNEPSCVGLLTNLFREREGVVRSYHPTHSVAAMGKDAADYVAGEELTRTPCPRHGCWGRLYDRNATILFLGCSLKRNTFLHSVEEWENVPNRIAPFSQDFTVMAPDGQSYIVPQYRHHTGEPSFDVSQQYDIMEPVFAKEGAIGYGQFGDAKCIIGSAVKMGDITAEYLRRDPKLFDEGAKPLE
ncbi:MAG: AAC(3) family N-acetyltransferase [Lachnospiraceae bacterium]|nr:AAC(3) family N-acetyltransferase [Lachnospiraceae bacterium]